MATSYNGWPASRDPKAIGINTTWEPIPNHRFPGGVKAGDVETVLTYVVRQLDARVEPIDRDAIKDEWGWHYKPSANSPDTLSCHSSGTAFDYNATRHPNRVRGTFSDQQVKEIRKILAECDGVVRWLGDARTADEMHFEIRGTASQVAAVAKRLRKPTPIPTPVLEDDDMLIVRGTDDAKTKRPARLIAGGFCPLISVGDRMELEKKGVISVVWDNASYDNLVRQAEKAFP